MRVLIPRARGHRHHVGETNDDPFRRGFGAALEILGPQPDPLRLDRADRFVQHIVRRAAASFGHPACQVVSVGVDAAAGHVRVAGEIAPWCRSAATGCALPASRTGHSERSGLTPVSATSGYVARYQAPSKSGSGARPSVPPVGDVVDQRFGAAGGHVRVRAAVERRVEQRMRTPARDCAGLEVMAQRIGSAPLAPLQLRAVIRAVEQRMRIDAAGGALGQEMGERIDPRERRPAPLRVVRRIEQRMRREPLDRSVHHVVLERGHLGSPRAPAAPGNERRRRAGADSGLRVWRSAGSARAD